MKILCALVVGAALVAPTAQAVTDDEFLMVSYLKYQLVKQIPKQVAGIGEGLDADAQAEISSAATAWSKPRWASVKEGLSERFGENARGTFEAFVANLTKMEQQKNESYLQFMCKACEIPAPWPRDYTELRRVMTNDRLSETLKDGGAFLGEVQTWSELKKKDVAQLPPLTYWLARTEDIQLDVPPKQPENLLREAEAALPLYVEEDEEDTGFLDDFGAMRDEKRAQQVEEAKAAMAQVAEERRAAEEDYAARKLAVAQKEAEGMKLHAQELASVEAQALKQRERTWGARLKRIVGATVSAAGGALIGEVGSRAGQEAADALFD